MQREDIEMDARRIDSGIDVIMEKCVSDLTMEDLNSCTSVKENKERQQTTYIFDYGQGQVIVGSELLDELRRVKHWGMLEHPFILNYINERLIDCALTYTVNIILFISCVFLLITLPFTPTLSGDGIARNIFVTIFLLIGFGRGMVLKFLAMEHWKTWYFGCLLISKSILIVLTIVFMWASGSKYLEGSRLMRVLSSVPFIVLVSVMLFYELSKTRFAMYILMSGRMLITFAHMAVVWIYALIVFAIAFTFCNKGVEPWSGMLQLIQNNNASMNAPYLFLLQTVTKTSTMMLGELEVNDILKNRLWYSSVLLLLFEVLVVILFMNLLVALAVGDLNDLWRWGQVTLLRIKINFVIESLKTSKFLEDKWYSFVFFPCGLHRNKTRNVLIVEKNGDYETVHKTEFLELEVQVEGLPKRAKWYKERVELPTEDGLSNGKYTLRIKDPSELCSAFWAQYKDTAKKQRHNHKNLVQIYIVFRDVFRIIRKARIRELLSEHMLNSSKEFRDGDAFDFIVEAENANIIIRPKAKLYAELPRDNIMDVYLPDTVTELRPITVAHRETVKITFKFKGAKQFQWYNNGKAIRFADVMENDERLYNKLTRTLAKWFIGLQMKEFMVHDPNPNIFVFDVQRNLKGSRLQISSSCPNF